jgi:LPXTG-site transpeptidase (sortase) family protein
MRDKGDNTDLRSRYRHQPARRTYSETLVVRQKLAARPHAAPKKNVDGVVVPVKRIKKTPLTVTPTGLQNSRSPQAQSQRPIQRKKPHAHKERPVQRSYVLKRESVERPDQSQRSKFIDRIRQPQTMLVIAGVVVFVFGMTVSIMGIKTNKQVAAQPSAAQHARGENSDENPDEKDPGAVGSYKVAPDMPRRINIPNIKVNARILALGVKSDNQLKAPTNIYDAGWYQKSAKPGENGAMLIDGHVHGPTKPGVFYNLKKLVAGDRVTVERGDGQVFNYTVVKSQSYPKDAVDMAAAITPAIAGKQGLNIITCNGSLSGTSYEERLVVFAVRE